MVEKVGEGGGVRTHDPRIKSPLLCQLSYAPINFCVPKPTSKIKHVAAPSSNFVQPACQLGYALGGVCIQDTFKGQTDFERNLKFGPTALPTCGQSDFAGWTN